MRFTWRLRALMGACLSNQRPDLGAEVYKRISSPDAYAMSQGLEAFCRSGDLPAAAELLSTQKRGSRTLSGKQELTIGQSSRSSAPSLQENQAEIPSYSSRVDKPQWKVMTDR